MQEREEEKEESKARVQFLFPERFSRVTYACGA